MKQILFLNAITFTLIMSSKSQDTSVLKRTSYTLKVDGHKKNFYKKRIEVTPYLFPNNGMQIYPGETICVEVDEENGMIKNMNAVKEITKPNTNLTIKLSQRGKRKFTR